jgi:hypothetical protein
MTKSKRKTERSEMFKVVRYSIDGRRYADLSKNISSNGIFIKNVSPPKVGSLVTFIVELPEEWGNLPIKVMGRVVHTDSGSDTHERGMGVEFISVVADSLPIIEYFVSQVYDQDLKRENLEKSYSRTDRHKVDYEYDVSEMNSPSITSYRFVKKKKKKKK